MREIELKLDLTESAAGALEGSTLITTDRTVRQLSAVYYDTPDHALVAAGLSLRIRADGSERIQTVKADGAGGAGLFVRSEWEAAVEGDAPILDNSTPIKALLGERVAELAPIFEVNVERCIWTLCENDAEVELVLDRGHVLAGDRRAVICEAELELKAGTPGALFGFARQLDDTVPVRLGVLTKAERGYMLAKRPRSVFKAEPVSLRGQMTAAQTFQDVAQTCVRQFRLNEAVLLNNRAADTLHQARVALRRLRSAFSIFRPLFGADERAADLREELRWLAGELGHARDLDVFLERTPAGELQQRVQEAREQAYDRVEAVLASRRVRRMMLELVEWLLDGRWLAHPESQDPRGEPAREFASDALDRFRRKVKKNGRDLETADDETRHDVRKDAKKLRYASEFFVSLFDGKRERRRHKRFSAALVELQDQLGTLNDLAAAPEVIRKLGVEDDPEAQSVLLGGKRKALISAAAEAHGALVNAKPFWR